MTVDGFEIKQTEVALTTNDASVIGVGQDVAADFLSYSIPYYIVFQNDIDELFSSVFLEDFRNYAPKVVNGVVTPRGPLSHLYGEEEDDDAYDDREDADDETDYTEYL